MISNSKKYTKSQENLSWRGRELGSVIYQLENYWQVFFIGKSNLSVYYIQSPQETQNPPAATPLCCESSLELSWNHLIYDYKAYQTTSFEFKALPLSLTERWNDINPWSQLQMRSQLLRMAIDAEGYKLSKWSTPEMMTCSSWLSWPFSWSTHFVSLYLSPLNLKINCYYLLPFLFAAGDCYMLNSWWQLMLTYIWTGGTLLTLPGSAEAAGRDLPVTTPKCFKDSDCETKPPCPARRCPCLYC